MHSMSTLTVSRSREKPASSIMNPACMKNTRNAAISVHMVFTGLIRSFAATAGSCIGDAPTTESKKPSANLAATSASATPINLPPRNIPNSRR